MEPRRAGRPADYTGLDPATVRSLEFLGLSAYEIKVYLSILGTPRVRVPDIARLANVPQPKVYSTIKRLIGRGLIQSELGPVNRYCVIDPQHGFNSLLHDVGHREGTARAVVGALSRDFITSEHRASAGEGRVKLFQSRPAATRSFRDRLARVKSELAMVVQWPLVLNDYTVDIRRITADGGRVRMLCEVPDDPDLEHTDFIDRMHEMGAEIRRVNNTPMRLALFDAEAVALPMIDPAPHEGDGFMMLDVRNPGMTEGFRALFDRLWDEGVEI